MTSRNNKSGFLEFSDDSSSRSNLQGCLSQDMFGEETSSRDEVQFPTASTMKVDFQSIPVVPKVAVREKIIICIDNTYDKGVGYSFANTEPNSPEPSPYAIRNTAIKLFITNKLAVSRETEFAIASIEQGGFKWHSKLTSDVQSLMNLLPKLKNEKEAEGSAEFDLTPMFSNVLNITTLPDQVKVTVVPPNFVVRLVLVYNNSFIEPKINVTDTSYIKFITSPFCVLDVFYLHEKQSDFNNVEIIYKCLGKIVSPTSYIFESSRNVMKVFNNMAKLLAHPYQRVNQDVWEF
ncbi:Component of the BRCA1-A complex [Homalodisca vitripennis]|nr:Component of the BRCA1-A complex [Homalodisca vitripennis]KAG8309707.1 Component of the BRCA1-A complex [Homalodisca vitripennis]